MHRAEEQTVIADAPSEGATCVQGHRQRRMHQRVEAGERTAMAIKARMTMVDSNEGQGCRAVAVAGRKH